MVAAEPRTFIVAEQDAVIRLANIRLQRAFEADHSGKTTIHVWVEATATPAAQDFETIEGSVHFVLYDGDSRIGSCTARDLAFKDEDDSIDIVADEKLRIDTHRNVTQIEVDIDAKTTTRSQAKLTLSPE